MESLRGRKDGSKWKTLEEKKNTEVSELENLNIFSLSLSLLKNKIVEYEWVKIWLVEVMKLFKSLLSTEWELCHLNIDALNL